MNQSLTIAALAAALAKAQAEFGAVPMNSRNPHLNNRYADLGDVIQTAKPIMAKHGLSIAQPLFGDSGTVGVSTILLHSSGEWISSDVSLPLDEQKGLKTAQVAGSIVSYLRRYSYASILGLYADEDTDAEANHRQPQVQQQRPQPPKPAPPDGPAMASAAARNQAAEMNAQQPTPQEPPVVLQPGQRAAIPDKPVNQEQMDALVRLAKAKGVHLGERCVADFGCLPEKLTYAQAGKLITKMSKEVA